MLTRLTIQGFKRFRDPTPVDLDDLTVLIGANNSGKSTILQALTLFQYCVETTRRSNGNGEDPEDLSLANTTVGFDEFAGLPAAHPGDLWPDGQITRGGKPTPISLTAQYSRAATIEFRLQVSFNRFSIKPRVSGTWREAIRTGDIRLIPIFTGFLPREEFLTPPARQDRLREQRHGEMVRNLLWQLRENAPQQWSKLQDFLVELYPESRLDVNFDIEVDRFLKATYRDEALKRGRDVITAGSGFHQTIQILASTLAPGASVLLLDEPDAHLHARLQSQLMGILERLAREGHGQFVLATHSPQILIAAPQGAVRVCQSGRVVPLDMQPEQLQLLGDLGAMDQMEIVPLLVNRAVVFVENKSDRKLLEAFARRHWGPRKQQRIWRALTFLHTYQGPVEARILNLARQVRDVLAGTGAVSGSPVRLLAIGDRDYRTARERRADVRELNKKARSNAYKLDFRLLLWEANEIENYLLDRSAILRLLDRQAAAAAGAAADRWRKLRPAFQAEWDRQLASEREAVLLRTAERLQRRERGLALTTALDRARADLAEGDECLAERVDAKVTLSGLRTWLQQHRLPFQIAHEAVIRAMETVPQDVQRVLRQLQLLGRSPRFSAQATGRK